MDKVIDLNNYKEEKETKVRDEEIEEISENLNLDDLMEYFGVESAEEIDLDAEIDLDKAMKNKRTYYNNYIVIDKFGVLGTDSICYNGSSEIDAMKRYKEIKAEGKCATLALANVNVGDIFGNEFIIDYEIIEVLHGTK